MYLKVCRVIIHSYSSNTYFTKFGEEIVYHLQYFFLVTGMLISAAVFGSHNWAMFGQHLYSTLQSNITWKNCPRDIFTCIYVARQANGIRFSAKGQYCQALS